MWTYEKLENPYRAIIVECSTAEALPDREYGPEFEAREQAQAAAIAWVSAMAGGADGRWFLFPPGLRMEYVEIRNGEIKRATDASMIVRHVHNQTDLAWLGDVNFDDLTPAESGESAAVLALAYDRPEKIAVFKLID
jgi:hypothetical protein